METFKLEVPEVYCPQNKKGYFICCTEGCAITSLLCNSEQCSCKTSHPLICEYAQVHSLLKQLTKRVEKTTIEIHEVLLKLDNFYVQMIKMIEEQRKKIKDIPLTILMSESQGIFYSTLCKRGADQINGKLVRNVKRSVCSQKNTQLLTQGIQSYKMTTDEKIINKKEEFTKLLSSVIQIWDKQRLKQIVSKLNAPQSQINVKSSFISSKQ